VLLVACQLLGLVVAVHCIMLHYFVVGGGGDDDVLLFHIPENEN